MDYHGKIVSLGLVAMLSGCAANLHHQQKDNVPREVRNEIWGSAVKVTVEGELEIKMKDGSGIKMPETGLGTGVAIYDDESDRSYVLTDAHVVLSEEEPNYTFKVNEIRADVYPAKVIKQNETFDLALLEVEGVLSEHYKGKIAKGVEIGDLIIGAGYPLGEEKAFFNGHVASFEKGEGVYSDIHQIFGAPQWVVTDVHITPGNSGSGVYVLQDGEPLLAGLIHIRYLRKEGLKGITSAKVLRGFVKGTAIEDELLR